MLTWLHKCSSIGSLIVYHATMAGNKILGEGFKTRVEVGEKAVLGGGTSNSVSFTTDWSTAKGIFDAVIFFWEIANAPNSVNAVKTHFNSLPDKLKSETIKMLQAVHGGNPKLLPVLMDGMILDGSLNMFGNNIHDKPLNIDQMNQYQYKPFIDQETNEEWGVVDGRYYNWLRPMTPDEIHKFIYSYVKAYLAANPQVYNPIFFGSDTKNFIGVNRNDIGIITAEIEIDPNRQSNDDFGESISHRYVGSMAELRVYDKNIIKRILDFDTNPGDKPKYKSEMNYYGKSDPIEKEVNKLLQFIYKNYKSVQKMLNAEQIVSLLQEYGHDYWKLAEIYSAIVTNTKMKDIKYVVQEYKKYKDKIKVSPEVKNALKNIPLEYAQRILNGERADDVIEELYDADKNAYSLWYDNQEDAYQANRLLEDFTWDRKRYLDMFERYAKPSEDLFKNLYGDTNPDFIVSFYYALEEFQMELSKTR